MSGFESLVSSRKDWLESVLRPWCQQAELADLRKAEQEWLDLAGRPSPESTLWTWAWSRFPELVYDGLVGVNETRVLRVCMRSGLTLTGYPDGRRSQRGELWLISVGQSDKGELVEHGPLAIDQIESVEPVE